VLQIVACKHKLQSKIPVAKRTRSVQCKEMAELKGGGLCRPDCVSLPRVITYGVNPAHFNKDDHQSPPKTLRVANVNNVIAPELIDMNAYDQTAVDQAMLNQSFAQVAAVQKRVSYDFLGGT